MTEYWESIEPDRTIELASIIRDPVETGRRLLYMLKHCMNGDAMILVNKTDNAVEALSPEFTEIFGYEVADMNPIPENFWHEDDREMTLMHSDLNLAGDYRARCRKKTAASYKWYEVVGLCIEIEGRNWRIMKFVPVTPP